MAKCEISFKFVISEHPLLRCIVKIKMKDINIETEYQEALSYLFSQLPMFSRVGAAAYKPGLERVEALDNLIENPHRKFKSIHIAGTNGKGSTSHMLASVLQSQGYKTALYTSPHLVDFRERMRVNGAMIPKEEVVRFTQSWKDYQGGIKPSFFELTMMMAFDWFAREDVDFAVIEVGMGGRLDSTNIITPIQCAITNISPDHTQFLGDTLAKIAGEKAGIIKAGIPVVIGETNDETRPVFEAKIKDVSAPATFAEDNNLLTKFEEDSEWGWRCTSPICGDFYLPLAGDYQRKNLNTVLNVLENLRQSGFKISDEAVRDGIANVEKSTGLMGRWTRLASSPLTICDTGHNIGGLSYTLPRLKYMIASKRESYLDAHLRMLIGFVEDKDVDHILPLFPMDAEYYICQAGIPRAMAADKLAEKCRVNGFKIVGVFPTVSDGYEAMKADANPSDILFIGGSTFVVADLLSN